MHYMPFWITYKTCNNIPDFREEEKKKGRKKITNFSTELAKIIGRPLVNETRIVGTEESETPKN